jgi:group I intron endonuclease
MNKVSGIYVIINTKSMKVYLGQAQNIKKRWYTHKYSLNLGTHYNPYLQRAWIKYGAKAFKFQILEYCSIDQLNEREQHFLNIYISKGLCYNIAIDATAPMRGRTHKNTDETKRKMSEVAKGRVFTQEHKQRLSEAQRRRPPASSETRKRISEAAKNPSSETRLKMSIAKKNMTDETKRKIGEAAKKMWAKRRAEKESNNE